MHTHSHPQQHITFGLAHKGHGRLPVRMIAGRCLRTTRGRIARGKTAPGLMLLVSALFILLSACSQQPSQDLLNQMNARLEQLEKKTILLEEKDIQLTEFANDAKATSIKLEEKMSELTQQIEKISSRPSVSPVGKPAQSPASVSQGKKQQHTVSRGETLYSIAKRYGLSVDDLRRLNHLSQDRPIQTGQKLVVVPGAQE